MSIGWTSAFTKTSIRILATTLLVGLFPGVSADCYIDWEGYEQCGLSSSAIAGIAVGGFFVLVAVILIMWACLRRRPVQTNVVYPPQAQPAVYLPQGQPGTYLPQVQPAYLPQTQPGTGMVYGNPYGTGQPQFIPQYPPQYPLQAQKGVTSPQGYGPSSGYAPGTGSPPQHVANPLSPESPQHERFVLRQ